MCGVDSLSFPPTITKLIYNILSNHLILLPLPVSEVYLFTFPRKGSSVYSSFTSIILETCPISLILLQPFTLDLSLSSGSFTLACTHAQVLPQIINKKNQKKKKKTLALVPVSTLFLLSFLYAFLHCKVY